MKNFLTYTQLAEKLNVSRRTIERHIPAWLAEGKLSVVKIGRVYRVPEESAERLIEKLTVERVGVEI